jgi:hypothetical protein
MRPKIAMWSDYGAPRHKHWRTPSRRSSRSSIGPKILVAAVVVVAGVIGISGIYPQIIDSEWVQGTSPHSQRVALSEPTPTTRRSGIVADIPLPPRRVPVTTGEAVAPPPSPAEVPAPVRAAVAAPAPAPVARVAVAPTAATPAAPAPVSPTAVSPTPVSPPAASELRPTVAATEQPAADPDAAALAIADVPDAQAKADAPADPAAAVPAAPAAAARPAYAGRAPVVKRQRVVVQHRSRYSGAYAQWGGFGGGGFNFFGFR